MRDAAASCVAVQPELAGCVAAGLEQPEAHQATNDVGMEVRGAGERLEVEAERLVRQRPERGAARAHRDFRGSNADTAASCSNKRRSSSESVFGTMIRVSA